MPKTNRKNSDRGWKERRHTEHADERFHPLPDKGTDDVHSRLGYACSVVEDGASGNENIEQDSNSTADGQSDAVISYPDITHNPQTGEVSSIAGAYVSCNTQNEISSVEGAVRSFNTHQVTHSLKNNRIENNGNENDEKENKANKKDNKENKETENDFKENKECKNDIKENKKHENDIKENHNKRRKSKGNKQENKEIGSRANEQANKDEDQGNTEFLPLPYLIVQGNAFGKGKKEHGNKEQGTGNITEQGKGNIKEQGTGNIKDKEQGNKDKGQGNTKIPPLPYFIVQGINERITNENKNESNTKTDKNKNLKMDIHSDLKMDINIKVNKANINDDKDYNKVNKANINDNKDNNKVNKANINDNKDNNKVNKANINDNKDNNKVNKANINDNKDYNKVNKANINDNKGYNKVNKANINDNKDYNKVNKANINDNKDYNKVNKANTNDKGNIEENNENGCGNLEIEKENYDENSDVISVFGSTHQGASVFPRTSRGMQCTCNALVMLTKACSDFELGSDLIDTVLLQGDLLYNDIIKSLKHQKEYKSSLLNFDELPEDIEVDTVRYHIEKFDSIAGIVLDATEAQTLTLQSGFDCSFQVSDFALLIVGGLCSSLFYVNGTYYFFDSHSHGIDTLSCPDGKAIMMSFCSRSSLVQYLYEFYDSVNLLQNIQFEFLPLNIVKYNSVTFSASEKESDIVSPKNIENLTVYDKILFQNSGPVSQMHGDDQQVIQTGVNIPCASLDTNKINKKKQKRKKSGTAAKRKLHREQMRQRRLEAKELSGAGNGKRKEVIDSHYDSKHDISATLGQEINSDASDNEARIKKANNVINNKQNGKSPQKRVADFDKEQDGNRIKGKCSKSERESENSKRIETVTHPYYSSKYCAPAFIEQEIGTRSSANDENDNSPHTNNCISVEDSRQKRNRIYRERYHSDPVFREKKKISSREKYRQNLEYRERKKMSLGIKYLENEGFREEVKLRESHKYSTQGNRRQLKVLASSKKYKTNLLHQYNVKLRSTRKYRNNLQHRMQVKLASIQKYKSKVQHRLQVRRASIQKYKSNVQHRLQVRRASIQKYKSNVQHRLQVRRASIQKYKSNAQHRLRVKIGNTKRYRRNSRFRERVRTNLRNKYLKHSLIKERKITMIRKRRNEQSKRNRNLAIFFREQVSDGPKFICCTCHKFKFKKQVLVCDINKYKKKGRKAFIMAKRCVTYTYATKCSDDCQPDCEILNHNKIWICHSCHRYIMKGEMPVDAVLNSMQLLPMPDELKKLNALERQLLALRIPFMKVVNLPKGQQKGVIGPCVSIPTDIEKSTNVLPRSENDELVRVKLKRKLKYKGHCQYEYVSPAKIHKGIQYLQKNNHWYEGTTSNQNWENPIPDIDEVNHSMDSHQNRQQSNGSDNQTNRSDDDDDDDDDTEDEDLTRSKDKGLPFDTCLQPADMGQEILDQYFDGIFCVAPGEGKTPVSMLNEVGNEAMSFPAQFPDGTGTYDEKREVKLTRLRYFHARLLNADNRFSSDTQYLFYAQYLAELEQVVSQVSIALRKGTTKDQCNNKISANMIKDRDELRNLLQTDQGYKFLTPVRGTPPYWQTTLRDLFAMIRQLGIPTWFCTFSAADMRWTEIMEILLQQQGIDKSPDELDYLEKCEILRKSAIMNAVNFDHRFHTFLKYIIIQQEVIGKVKDHFHRIEFQMRGSPHAHCLFWIEDAPFLDRNDDDEVCSFVNKYVSCKHPNEIEDAELYEMVKSVQQHSKGHSKSCRKKGTNCRFNFPRPPSERTFISRSHSVTDPSHDLSPQQMLNQAKETLQKVWDVINNTDLEEITTKSLFAAAGITQDQFEEATNTLTKRTSIILERSPQDVWINQYNPTLLRCWNANMDIQYVTDAYSCVMYIISYISKAEREMGLILEEARKEAAEGNLDAQCAMKKIGGTYFHHREVSAQEAAYRVCGLHLKESSRKVQFIPVGNDPVRMSKPIALIQKQSDDDEDIWLPSITDRYKARPSGQQFESLCLASFCSKYRVLASSQIPKNRYNDPHVHMLRNDLGFIRERTRSEYAVVRYPRFSQNKDPELYYKSILQLFLPHRHDRQIKPPSFETFQDFYCNGAVKLEPQSSAVCVKSVVEANRQQFEIDADALDEAEELLRVGPLEDAWAMIGPENEADRLECGAEKQQHLLDEDLEEITELQTGQNQSNKDHSTEISNHTISKTDALPLLQSMNEKQKQMFYKVRQWCLDKINGKNPEPFQVFITGGAGTGKSHVIKCIHYEAHRILSPSASNPDDTVVLLTAPTGTAAFNIGGTTLHQAFALPQYLPMPYQHMRDEKLNTLRCKLQNLAILIIDEVSMVGQKVLTYVHERLRQIKQSGNALFGNVCVIAVGDFYQLPPVRQTSLYELHPKTFFSLWSSNFAVVELNQIMRQRNDAGFAEILNRLRIKKKDADLDANDSKCLEECEKKTADPAALHIFATNAEVDEHNKTMLQTLCDVTQTFMAQDFGKNITTGKLTKRDVPYSTSSDYLPSELCLAKGARVMLIRNIDVTDGLVNGVIGTINSIIPPPPGSAQSTAVSVLFDNNKIGQKQRRNTRSDPSLEPNSVIIRVVEETLPKNAVRYQFPLRLAWACTVHKVQGLTTDKLVVSFRKIFGAGMAYVALSRVTSLDGLMIKDFDADKIYCTDKVADALQRMPSFLSKPVESVPVDKSANILLHNIQGLIPHLRDLKSNSDITDSDYICLTETWMEQTSIKPSMESFELFHKDRYSCYNSQMPVFKTLKNMKHGGVAVFCNRSKNFEELPLNQSNIEVIGFQISDISTTVVLIYRPEIYTLSVFLDELDDLLQNVPQERPVLVIGDFNQDLLKGHTGIRDFMETKGYKQIVDTSTTDGNSLIDHVYVKGNINPPVRHDKKYRLYPHEQLVNAYDAVKVDGVSVHSASIRYGVPEQTLRDRVIGHIDFECVTTGRAPVLSLEEEAKIYAHLKAVAELGYGYTRLEVTDIASDFAIQLGKRSADNPFSINWFRAFRERWPKITVTKPRTLEFARAKGASSSAVNKYFNELELILDKYNLRDKPHLIYNIDEKGFMPNYKPPNVVATDDFHPQAVTPGKAATTTVIGAGSASGVAVPPYLIFSGVRMLPELLKDGSPGINGTVSVTGWSNTEIFRDYIKNHFLKFLPTREPDQHLLVLLDGHVSHAAVDVLEWARENNIIIFVLPAHTSHLLQPLDVACYGPLQEIYSRIAHSFTRSCNSYITRYDMCGLICRAYTKAVTPENLQAAFKKAGICPLDKNVISPQSVAPATCFNSDTIDSTITGNNIENNGIPEMEQEINEDDNNEVLQTADDQQTTSSNPDTNNITNKSPSSFLNDKLQNLKSVKSGEMKKRKPRRSLSKITSGKAVTERDVMEKIVAYNSESKSKSSKVSKVAKQVKIKSEKSKKKAVNVCNMPQPGPSHFYVSDSSQSLSDDEISESEKCCVCKLYTPKQIRESNYLQFTQWAQCDFCDHWVHLKFCTNVRVIRRGDKFACIHCKMPEE